MHPGWIGAIVGGALGLLGGVIGTYMSIKNTCTQAERKFIIRTSILMWIGLGAFLALLFIIPMPYNFFLFAPYGIIMPLTIRHLNKKQAEFRRQKTE
jgi:hypothetical protein